MSNIIIPLIAILFTASTFMGCDSGVENDTSGNPVDTAFLIDSVLNDTHAVDSLVGDEEFMGTLLAQRLADTVIYNDTFFDTTTLFDTLYKDTLYDTVSIKDTFYVYHTDTLYDTITIHDSTSQCGVDNSHFILCFIDDATSSTDGYYLVDNNTGDTLRTVNVHEDGFDTIWVDTIYKSIRIATGPLNLVKEYSVEPCPFRFIYTSEIYQ